jgi:UDP-glucuronate 4-epimerase
MRVIVTGGAGFIGSNLCQRLLGRGDQVLALDSFNDFYDPAVKGENVREVTASDKNGAFRVAEADIRDAQALDKIFMEFRPDAVVHLAAYAGVRPSIQNPQLYVDVNLMGTTRILDAMVKYRVKRLVFASSSSVYGNNEKVPFSEDDPVDHPISPYAATKKAGELLVHTYHALHGLHCACLRFFTVYGPRQRPDLAISKFVSLIRAGKPIPVYGDGSTRRDYTYIADILDGLTAALDWTETDGYDVFNLGESHTVSLSEMIETIERVLGKRADIDRLPMQPGDVKQTFADVSKARHALGYSPSTSFEEGVRKYVAWLDAKE